MRPTIKTRLLLVLTAFFALASCRSSGDLGSEPETLVNRSRVSFQGMMSDSQYPGLIDLAARAKGIIIVPNLIRAAFFFGGRGGNGVMLVRGDDGRWSPPAFYTIGGLSWGLQVGGQS
ncbi:MAG: lipid-binding SYLF domain-containing protein, partial [Alphaproteobacteria bacterium]|nr:lipid-binding SYLF domain-containing protein [Alphaproteobacteria bacterium]